MDPRPYTLLTVPPDITPWYQQDPEDITLEAANIIFNDPEAQDQFPNQWQALLASIKRRVELLTAQAKEQNPLAFVQPSYEQSLKLNAWIWGIDYLVDFDANRIGKTAGGIFNFFLWELPNDPDWQMFSWFVDHKDRRFKILRRPPISAVRKIREFIQHNKLNPNPNLPFDHEENIDAYNQIALWLNGAYSRGEFAPQAKKRVVWAGGPDKQWVTKEVLMPEFLKWCPKANLIKASAYEGEMIIEFLVGTKTHRTTVMFKSYDSDDTKWSGGAVDGILLSEGVPQDVFNEVRQRFKYPAYGGWDYTPYEPRNTMGKSALAHKVYKDPTLLPLTPFVFSGFGIYDAPTYILSEEKREDLVRSWKDDPQGEARLKGLFYSSSPVILKHYDDKIHALKISFEELRRKYSPLPLILFRGIDPGWGHVTACAWMALAPDNTKYIYRFYAEQHKSIEERCADIIRLSGNERLAHPKHKGLWYEQTTSRDTAIRATFIDHHTFKTDEVTKRPFAYNYMNNGLIVRPSITYGPKERATLLNGLLQPQQHLPHPELRKPPGSRLYFLCSEEGVAEAVQKMTNLFWLTFEKGDKRGLTKDTPQDYNDDELDATSYVACPTLLYHSFRQPLAPTNSNGPSTARTNSRVSYDPNQIVTV